MKKLIFTVLLAGCATTAATVAVVKTCAQQITPEVETTVFSALNAGSDTAFVDGLEAAAVQFGLCVVNAEVSAIVESFTTARVDAGTTVTKAAMAPGTSIVVDRGRAWLSAHQ